MGLSTSAIITIGAVFLFFSVLSTANRTISSIMMVVGICLIGAILLQVKTGIRLIDIEKLSHAVIQQSLSLGKWVDDAEGVPGEVAFVDFPGLLTQGKVIQQGDAAALALMPCLGDVGDSAVAQPGTARRGEEEP